MTRSSERPQSFTVRYHGQPIEFVRLTKEWGATDRDGEVVGYGYRCPIESDRKRAMCWVDTESGQRHSIEFDEQGRATIHGSLIHRLGQGGGGCHCGWHVLITNGIAEDA